jgi:hypothetical protein
MADNSNTAAQVKKFTLRKDNELRFEVDFNSKITLKVLYNLFCIISWKGATKVFQLIF